MNRQIGKYGNFGVADTWFDCCHGVSGWLNTLNANCWGVDCTEAPKGEEWSEAQDYVNVIDGGWKYRVIEDGTIKIWGTPSGEEGRIGEKYRPSDSTYPALLARLCALNSDLEPYLAHRGRSCKTAATDVDLTKPESKDTPKEKEARKALTTPQGKYVPPSSGGLPRFLVPLGLALGAAGILFLVFFASRRKKKGKR